jgi:pimeloyl-ACP methyl ester carboxylesterase
MPMPANSSPAPVSRFYSAPDGLRLHLRDWPNPAPVIPVVCLPGLARTAADFDALAGVLCASRRVVALDYRGRGLSDYDRNWRNYDLRIEGEDILSVLTAAGIGEAVFIGTSRGGLHAMILSALRPAMIRAVVLNDIGPVLEAKGLARIRGYVGKLPAPRSWADAADMARRLMSAQFTKLDERGWQAYAHLTFEEKNGRFRPRYDPRLMKTLEDLDLESPLPQLWPQFDGLRDVPMLILRGENSDLLSPETLAEMLRRHPGCEAHTVAGEGHAPLLLDTETIGRVAAFVTRVVAPVSPAPMDDTPLPPDRSRAA